MDWLSQHVLTVLIFLPIAGAVGIGLLPRGDESRAKWTALIISLGEFAISVAVFIGFSSTQAGFQFEENHAWIISPPINYHLGLDGLSLLLVLLTAFLTPLSILVSWKSISSHAKEFFLFLLALEAGTIGVFVAMDLFLFFLFWEAMLIPMYFLIGIWGHERRVYAAVKFIVYTMAGSALMLVGIIYLYSATGSFDFPVILQKLAAGGILTPRAETLLFLAFFVAFAIKVPMFPLHTWLPDAHVEAPTAGSVILAGVLLKMGTYGMLRFCLPLFPQAAHEYASIISVLAVVGIIYGSLVAMVQPDLKKLVAYSSVAHLGFVVLGIFAFNMSGIEGAIYQMCNHGVSTGALFIMVGLLYERRHTFQIKEYGGLATTVPVFATFFVIVALSSLGLPMLNGFVGEFLIIVGAFGHSHAFGAIAAFGVVLAAVYLLWMVQRVFYGEVTNEKNRMPDCSLREKIILVTLVLTILGMGIYPQLFLRKLDTTVTQIIQRVEPGKLAYEMPRMNTGQGR